MVFKLIKNNLPEVITQEGRICNYAISQNEELFINLLNLTLIEETNAFLASGSLENLVEIQIIIDTFKEKYPQKFEQLYKDKIANNEVYSNRYIGFFQDPVLESTKE